MSKIKIYQVDAFTSEKFKGNPAAVCILPDDRKVDESWMQSLAAEMNLSETAFVQGSNLHKTTKKGGGVLSFTTVPLTIKSKCLTPNFDKIALRQVIESKRNQAWHIIIQSSHKS